MGGVFPEDEWHVQRLGEESVLSARIFGSQDG